VVHLDRQHLASSFYKACAVPPMNLWHEQFSHFKGYIPLCSYVCMHSCIVNGYQLMCDAQTVLEPHRETAALFLFYSLLSFSAFLFMCLSFWQSLFLFLGASIVCVYKRTADCLVIPWSDICLYTPQRLG